MFVEVVCMKLTAKQQAWIDYYKQGHTAAEAARLAGYEAKSRHAFESIGHENLRKLDTYIAEREAVLESSRIADMEEINALWTEAMRDKGAGWRDRLEASKLRARSLGAFLDRQEITVQPTGWYMDDTDDEAPPESAGV